MKKQFYTLTAALLLSASAVFAACPCSVKNVVKAPVVAPQPPCPCVSAQPMSREQFKKNFEAKMAQDRENLYNELSLTCDQKTKSEALFTKSHNELKPLMAQLKNERKKMADLKKSKSSARAIAKQKIVVKKAKTAVKTQFEKTQKDFRAILTEEQSKKYDALIAERKAQMEQFKKEHKHMKKHGHGPDDMMSPEGFNGPCPVPPTPSKNQ